MVWGGLRVWRVAWSVRGGVACCRCVLWCVPLRVWRFVVCDVVCVAGVACGVVGHAEALIVLAPAQSTLELST